MKILKWSFVLILASQMAFSAELDPAKTYSTKQYPISHSRGLVRNADSRNFLENAPRRAFLKTDGPVPATYSLRGKAGPVENQGTCGSCWDFSLTTALRGTLIMGGKDPGRLSFNYLLNCDTIDQGCNGGDFSAAQNFLTPLGAPAYGSDGKYKGSSGTCKAETPIASATQFHLLGSDSGAFPNAPTPSFQDIAYVVGVLHRPVSIDVAVDNNWEGYSGGTYNGCSDEDLADINHMVVIEGYNCEKSVDKSGNCVFDAKGGLPPDVGTWLIRNSWGTSWGDQGYITTKATDSSGKACNAVASDALYYEL